MGFLLRSNERCPNKSGMTKKIPEQVGDDTEQVGDDENERCPDKPGMTYCLSVEPSSGLAAAAGEAFEEAFVLMLHGMYSW